MLQWYNSDIGKEIVVAEKAAASEQAMMAIQQQAQQLAADQFRMGLAQRLDQILSLADVMLEMQAGISIAMVAGMSSVSQGQALPDMKAVRAQIEANIAPMRSNLQMMVVLMMVYSYKNIDEDKLKKI